MKNKKKISLLLPCVCCNVFTVSKGYSNVLQTKPLNDPARKFLNASLSSVPDNQYVRSTSEPGNTCIAVRFRLKPWGLLLKHEINSLFI